MGEGRITLTSPNLIMLSEFFEVNYSNGKTTDSKIYVSRNYTNARVFFRKIKNDSKEHEFKYFNYFNIDEKYVETSLMLIMKTLYIMLVF